MTTGTVASCVGGLFTVLPDSGAPAFTCRARGSLKKTGVEAGDRVTCEKIIPAPNSGDNGDFVISSVEPRINSLIRPAVANLSRLFVVLAPSPLPDLLLADKLLSLCVYADIPASVIITKNDIPEYASSGLFGTYALSSFPVFSVSSLTGGGIKELSEFIVSDASGENHRPVAFAGASGVGKSSLINALFPGLLLETGGLSKKISRGRHTTRTATLYPVSVSGTRLLVADTPGFSMLDFEDFDFFSKDELASTFPEFSAFISDCRYRDCSHTKESAAECAVVRAVNNGKIALSRHENYKAMYEQLSKLPFRKPRI